MKTWFTTDCKAWYHRGWYLQWPLWNIQKKRKAIFIQSTVQSISYVRNAQKGLSLKRKNILNLACSSIFILLVHFMFWGISFDVRFSKTHFIKFQYSNISSLSNVFSYKHRREGTISGTYVLKLGNCVLAINLFSLFWFLCWFCFRPSMYCGYTIFTIHGWSEVKTVLQIIASTRECTGSQL